MPGRLELTLFLKLDSKNKYRGNIASGPTDSIRISIFIFEYKESNLPDDE